MILENPVWFFFVYHRLYIPFLPFYNEQSETVGGICP